MNDCMLRIYLKDDDIYVFLLAFELGLIAVLTP